MVKKFFFGKYLNLYPNYPNSGRWSIKKKKKRKFSNLAYYIFLERKFNFQYNGENFKCIVYPEQKLFKFLKNLIFYKKYMMYRLFC